MRTAIDFILVVCCVIIIAYVVMMRESDPITIFSNGHGGYAFTNTSEEDSMVVYFSGRWRALAPGESIELSTNRFYEPTGIRITMKKGAPTLTK